MMKLTKRWIAILLAAILAVCALPVAVFAAPDAQEKVLLETLPQAASDGSGDSFIGTMGTKNATLGVSGYDYGSGLEAWVDRQDDTAEKSWVWAEYDLGGSYSTLRGSLDVCAETLDGEDLTKNRHNAVAEILADGMVVFSQKLNAFTRCPISINLDVSGVSTLRIDVYDLRKSKGGSSYLFGDMTLFAGELNDGVYNLGEETYSFYNYSDRHSYGHCFGMAMTSSGYFNGDLDMDLIGGDGGMLYDYDCTRKVRKQICRYQRIQGTYAIDSIVAGGRWFAEDYVDAEADWDEVVSYVRSGAYNGTGRLVIVGFSEEGGHAVNFLRYEKVKGEERIYAYDNNLPYEETYFYKDKNGAIRQSDDATFYEDIFSISLHDEALYFQNAKKYRGFRAVYAIKGMLKIDGAVETPMADMENSNMMMYELPENVSEIKIIPLIAGATFTYMDREFSFDEVLDGAAGILRLALSEEDTGTLTLGNGTVAPTKDLSDDGVTEAAKQTDSSGAVSLNKMFVIGAVVICVLLAVLLIVFRKKQEK